MTPPTLGGVALEKWAEDRYVPCHLLAGVRRPTLYAWTVAEAQALARVVEAAVEYESRVNDWSMALLCEHHTLPQAERSMFNARQALFAALLRVGRIDVPPAAPSRPHAGDSTQPGAGGDSGKEASK